MKPGYADWIAGAAFNDRRGVPQIWHHGTDADEFNVFTRWDDASIGFHFGTLEAAKHRTDIIYRMSETNGGTIIPVLCRAQRPLRLRDQFMWEQDDVARALLNAGVLKSQDEVDFVIDDASEAMIFAAIEAAGYDCVVYKNECETDGKSSDSLMVWRAELLKHPEASRFDLDDPRLLPQKMAAEKDIKRWKWLAREIKAADEALTDFQSDPEAHFAEMAVTP